MHQVSLETICPLKAFQLDYCPDNDAKSMVKHLIFLQEFAVVSAEALGIFPDRTYSLPANPDKGQ